MVLVTVNRPFHDLVEDVDRHAGETFEAEEGRAARLKRALPAGYVKLDAIAPAPEPPKPKPAPEPVPEPEPEQQAEDLSRLTIQQLRAVAKERGIELPKRAKKTEIVKILEG